MIQTIRHEFTDTELLPARFPEPYMLHALREAGIPVLGFFMFGGLTRGTLTRWDNFDRRVTIFEWKDK